MNEIKLTQTVKKSGCAAKLPAQELRRVLSNLKAKKRPELLLGSETLDDAALWDLGDGRLLVQTLDFFTPIVDDPKNFGAVAATNSLSDVYAMGGEPITALGILAFPTQTLPLEILESIMQGALEKIEESGACLAGGHSIDDDTLKFGLSVTGIVSKDRAWTNAGAKEGDVLILTKPLGVGTLVTANKENAAKQEWMNTAIECMKTLNRVPDLLKDITVNAATDVTGFGLAGHGMQMAQASGVVLEINTSALPILPGALECIENGMLNKAHKTNSDYTEKCCEYYDVSKPMKWLTVDAQTSGGLLLSIPQAQAERALEELKKRFVSAKLIGRVKSLDQNVSSSQIKYILFK